MAGKMTIYKLVVLGDGGVGKVSELPFPLKMRLISLTPCFDLIFSMMLTRW
jgi:hypothetical protein